MGPNLHVGPGGGFTGLHQNGEVCETIWGFRSSPFLTCTVSN